MCIDGWLNERISGIWNMNEEVMALLIEIRPEFDFAESENYIDEGLLDSFDIITLIDMIEEKYAIKIDGMDVVPENFDTTEHIVGLIKKSGGTVL